MLDERFCTGCFHPGADPALATLKAEFDLTYIFISHDLAVVEAFCDRIAVMYFGEVVEIAAANSVFASAAHPIQICLPALCHAGDDIFAESQGELPDPLNPPQGCLSCALPGIWRHLYEPEPFTSQNRLGPMSPATLKMKIEKNDGPRASKPLRVAEAIKHWVVAEGMRPGDKLPSEAELMERYGHSKGTIREAMRILEAQGLLKTRTGPGGGSFVHEVSEARTRALLANYFYFRDLTIQDIYQLRKQLEPDLVYSLAGKLSDDVLDDLKAITDKYAEPPGNAEEDRRHHEIALTFHAKLAEQSDNQLLGFIIRFMADTLSEVTTSRRLFEPANRELWSKGREYQLRVLKALRAGNGPMARDVMLEHMQFAEKLMIQQELRVKRQFGDL